MFPRHVRWYRLLLMFLVVVNCDEAIAKTDSNLNLDSGSGIFVTCPAVSIGPAPCGDVAPSMQPSFTNSISDGDVAAFSLIGGSITGTPCGEVIILGIENGTGIDPQGCNFITRQFLIYDDANIDGILSSEEFIQTCTVDYAVGDESPPEVFGSQPLFLECSFPDIEQEIDFWLELGAFTAFQDCNEVQISNNFSGTDLDFCSSFEQEVTFTFTDLCGNSTEIIEPIIYNQNDPFVDCFPISVSCIDPEGYIDGPQSLTEFNFFYGFSEFCNQNEVILSFVDSEPFDFCSIEEGEVGSIERTYNFTDNTCGEVYSCETTIEYFRTPLEIACPDFQCEIGLLPGATTLQEFEAQGGFAQGCGDLTISFVDTPPLSGTDICDVGEMIRTYTITDECGSIKNCQQFFTFSSPIELTCPPNGQAISCITEYASSGILSAEEYFANGIEVFGCSEFVLSYQDTPSNLSPCDTGISITRELTLESSCEETRTCSYTFVFDGSPIEIECPIVEFPVNLGDPSIEPATTVEEFLNLEGAILNSCSPVSISHNDFIDVFEDGFGFIEREYFFTNDCGDVNSCFQFIEIFTNPSDFTIDCGAGTDIVVDCNDADPNGASLNDLVLVGIINCEADLINSNLAVSVSNNFNAITYSGSGTTQDIIFTVSDNFGNTVECPKTITLIGDCPIGIDCDAAIDIVVDCNDAADTPNGLNDLIAAQATICGTAIADASISPDGGPVSVFNNFASITYSGSGTTQDIIFTVVDNQGAVTQCPKTVTVIGDCKSITCPTDLTVNCQDGFPEPATTVEQFLALGGAFDFAGCGVDRVRSADNIAFEDIDFCASGEITISRDYLLRDGCGEAHTCTQTITYLPFTDGATINCPDDLTVDTNTADCTYSAILTPPNATSNCSAIGVVSVTSQFTNNEVILDEGVHEIEWTATDECGRTSICTQIINVVGSGDNFMITCQGPQLAFLEDSGTVNLEAEEFVNNISDACGSSGPYEYQVRRLSPGQCSSGAGDEYANMITFCCEDLANGVINLSIRVLDVNLNEAFCETTIEVRDQGIPTITCPSNMDVSCTNTIDITDLSAFGSITATDNCTTNLLIEETIIDNRAACGLGQILRTFTITDASNNTASCTQTINITGDSAGPILDCPDLSVDANTADCRYIGTLTPPNAVSSCPNVNIVSVTSQFPNNQVDLGGGDHIIEWKATDECGQITFCQQTITVNGAVGDFALVCEGLLCAFLEDDGTALVPASQFVYEIYDDCGAGPYTYEIQRRKGPGACDNDPGATFAPFITVCCEDLEEGQINIDIRVTNGNGDQAFCQPILEVKDLIAPVITSCPADQNVECTSIINMNDLSSFGTATATDNCPVILVESYEDNREDCGLGEIIRTFTFKDESNNTVSCTQVLTVSNNSPFVEDNIVWPEDNTFTNFCNDNIPDPGVAGSPSIVSNACSDPLVTWSDQILVEGPGCITITRKWVVLDWCQFDNVADQSTYRWEYNQIITLQNTNAPVFEACETILESCGNELTCTGMINLSVSATDDCSSADDLKYVYTLTLENGTIINGVGNSINAPYPYGNHSIVWGVNDGCGNFATCAQDIIIKDCKVPNAICLSGININLTQVPGGAPQAEIWAKDLDASSSDNCTETEALEYAFDMDFMQAALVFDCSHVGASQIVRMYVRDADGNVGFCKTTIGIQDNHNLCDDFIAETGQVVIEGRIATEGNLTMENVDVMLENSADPMHYMTDQNGAYAFENLPMYDNFNLVPTFQDDILNGISTIDVLYIQRHILGIEKLDSPYKIIAADVNNSKSVTAVDIIELRKVILGLKDEFNNSTVWRFVNPNDGMVDPENPFPYNENMTLTDLDHDANNMNFVGVKTGDVNYSALINGFIPETFSFRSQETLRLVSSSEERGSIQLTVNNDQLLSGFQLAFRVSGAMNQFNLSSSIIDIDENNYAIHDDVVKISWSSAEAIELTKGAELFSMSFGENGDYELLDDLPMYKVEAYDASLRSLEVEINLEDKTVDDEWQVFRNTPNPFVDNTFIPFTAPRESQLTLSVFDVNGRILFQDSRLVTEGYQKWELSATDIGNVHGVLYYRLESDGFSSTQPFIRLK